MHSCDICMKIKDGARIERWIWIPACILLAGVIFIGRSRIASQSIDTRKLGLDDMKDTAVYQVDVIRDATGEMTYQADNYSELQNMLGVHLLDGKLVNHSGAKIHGTTDNKDYHEIIIEPFVETDEYSLSMDVSIKCSPDQTKEGLLPEFLGEFEIKGDFISSQGYHVVVIGGKTEKLSNGSQGTGGSYTAVFVADGILYQLKGKTGVEELRRIINALSQNNLIYFQ